MKHTFYFKVLEMCACCVRQFENLPSTMGRFLRFCLKKKKSGPQQYTSYPSYCVLCTVGVW